MNIKLKQSLVVLVLVVFCGAGSALSLKAAVGVGAYDAAAMSFSYLTHIPVGTVGMIFNCLCVLGEFIILKKRFKLQHLLQIPLSIFLGFVVNVFLYNLFDKITITNYWIKLLLLLLSLIWLAAIVGLIMEINFVTFSLEGFCQAIAEKWDLKFSTLRQGVDIICVVICILLSILLKIPWTVREGTIIGALIFGPFMGIFMRIFRPILLKLNIIQNDIVID